MLLHFPLTCSECGWSSFIESSLMSSCRLTVREALPQLNYVFWLQALVNLLIVTSVTDNQRFEQSLSALGEDKPPALS